MRKLGSFSDVTNLTIYSPHILEHKLSLVLASLPILSLVGLSDIEIPELLSFLFFQKTFFLLLYRIHFTMTGLGRLLHLAFLLFWCVWSRSFCVSSISSFYLKMLIARAFVLLRLYTLSPYIRRLLRLEYCSCQFNCSVIQSSFSFKVKTSPLSSSTTFSCSCLSFSNGSNLFDINFIKLLISTNWFSSFLIWFVLLKNRNLWLSFTSFTKFLKQFTKFLYIFRFETFFKNILRCFGSL